MKIFIDSADLEEIKKYLSWGVCDGVTTNPVIFQKCGVTGGFEVMKTRTLEIAKLIFPRPMNVEVVSEDPQEILNQAREYSTWADNIVVKITITDRKGNSFLPLIHQLVGEGVQVNVTAITTFNQAIFAAKAIDAGFKENPNAEKPCFISIFCGRISDEHGFEISVEILRNFRQWLDFHKMDGIEIIAASIRSPESVEFWSRTGSHVLTIPLEPMSKVLSSARTRETVAEFIDTSKKILEENKKQQ